MHLGRGGKAIERLCWLDGVLVRVSLDAEAACSRRGAGSRCVDARVALRLGNKERDKSRDGLV